MLYVFIESKIKKKKILKVKLVAVHFCEVQLLLLLYLANLNLINHISLCNHPKIKIRIFKFPLIFLFVGNIML